MNRNFAGFHRAVLGCLTAAGLISCEATDTTGTLSTTDSPLAAVEGAQAGIGELKAQAEACLDTFALCVADEGETCRDELRACTPKPPKLEKLKGAMDKCKAGKAPPALTDDELAGTDSESPHPGGTDVATGEPANKPGQGGHPKCPPPPEGADAEAAADGSAPPPCPPPPPADGSTDTAGMDGAAPPADGQKPPKGPPPGGGPEGDDTDGTMTDGDVPPEGGPEGGHKGGKGGKGECGKIAKAEKKAEAKCDHHHDVVKVCIDDLELCVTDGGLPAECAATAKECLTAAAEARFATMCGEKLAACTADATSTEECDQIATKCAEGPKAPSPLPLDDSGSVDEAASGSTDESASAAL
jgi:hypothetical protein